MFNHRHPSLAFQPAESYVEALLDAAIEQIQRDLRQGDATAIYDLLETVPKQRLEGFLNEEALAELKQNW